MDDVFVPAGDADPPAGPYDGALPVLRRLSELGSPFARVGITGYPESHPLIHDDITIQAMWDKRAHATYIVSNLCFDARVLGEWIGRIRRRRCHPARPCGRRGARAAGEAAGDGGEDRCGGVDALPDQARVLVPALRGARRLLARAAAGRVRRRRSRRPRRGWPGCTCSRSTRSPRRSGGAARHA